MSERKADRVRITTVEWWPLSFEQEWQKQTVPAMATRKKKSSPNSPMKKNYSWGYSYLYRGFHRIRPFPFGTQNAAAGLYITAFRRQRGKCEALDRRNYSSSLTERFLTVFGRQRGSPVAIFSQPSTEHSVLEEEGKGMLLIMLLLVLVIAHLLCFLG